MKTRPMTPYEKRRDELEREGMTTSDAQAVIEVEERKKQMKTQEKGKPTPKEHCRTCGTTITDKNASMFEGYCSTCGDVHD